jgi:hypothetical protein
MSRCHSRPTIFMKPAPPAQNREKRGVNMNNFEKFLNGIPRETKPVSQSDFNAEYEFARKIGDKRFGSECKHEKVLRGKCSVCLRSVYSRFK